MSVVIEAVVEAGGVVRTDLPEGTAVKLVKDPVASRSWSEFWADIDAWRAANPDKLRSGEEIDRQIREERAAWGDA